MEKQKKKILRPRSLSGDSHDVDSPPFVLGAQVFFQLSLELLGASCQHLQLLTHLMRDTETSSTLVYISCTYQKLLQYRTICTYWKSQITCFLSSPASFRRLLIPSLPLTTLVTCFFLLRFCVCIATIYRPFPPTQHTRREQLINIQNMIGSQTISIITCACLALSLSTSLPTTSGLPRISCNCLILAVVKVPSTAATWPTMHLRLASLS